MNLQEEINFRVATPIYILSAIAFIFTTILCCAGISKKIDLAAVLIIGGIMYPSIFYLLFWALRAKIVISNGEFNYVMGKKKTCSFKLEDIYTIFDNGHTTLIKYYKHSKINKLRIPNYFQNKHLLLSILQSNVQERDVSKSYDKKTSNIVVIIYLLVGIFLYAGVYFSQ